MGCSKSSSKREVYSNRILPQEAIKAWNRQPNLKPKTSGKRTTKKKTKVSRRKEIIRIRPEINKKEIKETIVMINKTISCFFETINKIEKPLARLIKKKLRGLKSIIIIIIKKQEKVQQTPQKYKAS